MFLVSDGSRDNRKAIIKRIAAVDKAVGLILSEIDFEWTVRRAILRLSTFPTNEIRMYLKCVHGLDGYKKAWSKYVRGEKHNQIGDCLVSVVNGTTVKGRKRIWDELMDAVDARHRLVHGINGFIKDEDAERHMKVLFASTDAIADFCMRNGEDVFERIKPRRNPGRAKSATKSAKKHVGGGR